MKKGIMKYVILCITLASMLMGCNGKELEETKRELEETKSKLVKIEEELIKKEQIICDYEAVYGKIERSDIKNEINEINRDKNILVVSSQNPVSVVERDEFKISILGASYIAGNENIVLNLEIDNRTGQQLEAKIENAYAGEYSLPATFDNSDYFIDAGQNVLAHEYFSATSLIDNDFTNFDKLGCTLIVNGKDGSNLYSRDIVILRTAFSEEAM